MLGDAKADGIVIKGDVSADSTTNPDVDFSGTSGTTTSRNLVATGTMTVGGAASMNGDVTLGNAKADAIVFKGDVTADSTQNPVIDFSGTSGATVTGAVALDNAVTLGSLKSNTILFKGDVKASTSTNPDIDFSDSSGAFSTSGGSCTVGGALAVTGAASLNGDVTLGDAKADNVLIKGDITASSTTQPDIDFSGAASQSTPAGTFSVSGALVVAGASFLNGAVTLGDAKADAVLFKGDVTADSTTAPDIDFKDTPGFFKTSGGAVTMAGSLTVTGAATLNGDVTLGNAK